jgi:hypothetical protein
MAENESDFEVHKNSKVTRSQEIKDRDCVVTVGIPLLLSFQHFVAKR